MKTHPVRLSALLAVLTAASPALAQDYGGVAGVAALQGTVAAPGAYGLVGDVSNYGSGDATTAVAVATPPVHPLRHVRRIEQGHVRVARLVR